MVNLAVTIKRPETEELQHLDRSEKYARLRANSEQRLEDIKAWLDQRDLTDQVAHIDNATVFNILFLTAEEALLEELKHAPGVLDVGIVEDIEIDPLTY
jgi:hypothetical protein